MGLSLAGTQRPQTNSAARAGMGRLDIVHLDLAISLDRYFNECAPSVRCRRLPLAGTDRTRADCQLNLHAGDVPNAQHLGKALVDTHRPDKQREPDQEHRTRHWRQLYNRCGCTDH